MDSTTTIAKNCDCVYCKNNNEFSLSNELLDALLTGRVAVFAGAGISTESRTVLPDTFYDLIADQLGLTGTSLSFPELMETYCSQPNGRFKLLREIENRLEYIDSFPELKEVACKFHNELATFFPMKTIITTNWDTYFEERCKATPFVVDSDLAFWEVADRRVLKIHGSVSNLGTLVATTSDYEGCRERLSTGLIGGLLKTILATQTIMFIGYSFSDSDFNVIYNFVKNQMAGLHKQSYVVTPFPNDAERFKEMGLIPILTDGAYFFEQIKEHAVANELMLPDSIFDSAGELYAVVSAEHNLMHKTIKLKDNPQTIFSAFYQDGIMHALSRAIRMRGTGKYSNPSEVVGPIEAYQCIKKEKKSQGAYGDVAYIEGYVNALFYLVLDEEAREQIPLYYAFGCKEDLYELDDLIEFLQEHPNVHKASLKHATKILKTVSNPDSITFHHPPLL